MKTQIQWRCRAKRQRPNEGFTFVEILAAMLFMAIVIPVAVQGLSIATRTGVVAERSRTATQLADRLLTELVVTDEWRSSEPEGDFGEEWPRFRWAIEDTAWEEDTMRKITATVAYDVQGKEYTVQLSTLVDETEE